MRAKTMGTLCAQVTPAPIKPNPVNRKRAYRFEASFRLRIQEHGIAKGRRHTKEAQPREGWGLNKL